MSKKSKLIGSGCAVLISLSVASLWITPAGRAIRNLWQNGTIQAVLTEPDKVEYSATNEANLKALYTAMMLYHDSEGQFPKADGWMDAIQNRITSSDLKEGEGAKKLHNPALKPGDYGYAMNDIASGKYKEDVKEKDAVLIFESSETVRNAHGDPTKNRRKGGKGITLAGKIVG